MEKRTLFAIGLGLLVFLGWQKFYLEPQLPKKQAPAGVQQSESKPAQQPIKTVAASPATATQPVNEKDVELSIGTMSLSSGPHFFSNWKMKNFGLTREPDSPRVDLKTLSQEEAQVLFAVDHPDYAYLNKVQGQLSVTGKGAVWKYSDAKVDITREYQFQGADSFADVRLIAKFKDTTKQPKYAFLSMVSTSPANDPEELERQFAYWGKEIQRVQLSEGVALTDVPGQIKWISSLNRYFSLSLVAQGDFLPKALLQPYGQRGGRISLVYPIQGNGIEIPVRAYFGPKDLKELAKVEKTLDHAVDFGWFTIIAYPLLRLMKWFYTFFHNYGIAIILMTLLVKLVTYPLTAKSMKSMKKMAALQPQLQAMREKYKDDREALNREMLGFMRNNGYNPMSGCFPILIQMPIFIALFNVLRNSVELYQAPFMLWITDLSVKDPYYVTPALLTLTMWLQQKLTPNTATDPTQQKMMQLMPLIFGVLMLTLPSGLTLYMLVNAVASIAQQGLINRKAGPTHAPAVVAKAR